MTRFACATLLCASGIGCAPAQGDTTERAVGCALVDALPVRADEVTDDRRVLVPTPEGFEPQGQSARPQGSMHVTWPRNSAAPVRLEAGGAVPVLVRERGVLGEGRLRGRSVEYEREGGVSFWTAGEHVENWLSLEARLARPDAPAAAWDVEGASLRQRGSTVEVVDAEGTPEIVITAPVAYARSGRALLPRLVARASTLELWVDGEGEAVLVDPAWVATPPMAFARADHAAALLPDGRVLVTGGKIGSTLLASAELRDPSTSTWSLAAPMTFSLAAHTLTVLDDGRVLAAGLGNGQLYDPVGDTWSWNSMTGYRGDHTATLLSGGKVLIAGGSIYDWPSAAELFDPTTDTFTNTASMVTPRTDHAAARLADGRVLVTGGRLLGDSLSVTEIYDLSTDQWNSAAPMTAARSAFASAQLSDGRVLVAGGGVESGYALQPPLAACEIYDPLADSWSAAAPMAFARGAGAVATLLADGHVLVMAGADAPSEIYDPTTDSWASGPWPRSGRVDAATTALGGGKILVTGGRRSPGTYAYFPTVELFDPGAPDPGPPPPATRWDGAASLTTARGFHTASRLGDGRVLVVGGEPYYSSVAIDSAEIYDPIGDTWSTTASPPEGRTMHTASVLPDGKVLVTGGVVQSGGSSATTALFDPATSGWIAGPSMNAHRILHAATTLADGKVLVTGGHSGVLLPTLAELFDPTTMAWGAASQMAVGRYAHAAVRLVDGRVLVTGGVVDQTTERATAKVELFDYSTGTWSGTTPMSKARKFHAAVLLPDGKVLVAGGDWQTTGSTEIFDPQSSTWSAGPALTVPGYFQSATSLLDGSVLLAGGYGPFANADLYDPSARRLHSIEPMIQARYAHTSTLLENGDVLVSGGEFADGRAEIYRHASLLPRGSLCATAGDCATGFCAAGVCCDTTCSTGSCGTGTCISPTDAGPDGDSGTEAGADTGADSASDSSDSETDVSRDASGAETDADTGTDASIDTSDSPADSDTDAGKDADSHAEAGADTGTESTVDGSDSPADSNTAGDVAVDAAVETGTEAATESGDVGPPEGEVGVGGSAGTGEQTLEAGAGEKLAGAPDVGDAGGCGCRLGAAQAPDFGAAWVAITAWLVVARRRRLARSRRAIAEIATPRQAC